MRLADATWPEVPDNRLILVPVGSLEQHGPHLPLDTDTAIATAVAERVAELLEEPAQVAPAVAYGSSGEHQGFPGTVSIGTPVLQRVIVELVRSLQTWAGRIVLVNAHGGNVDALESAVRQLREERHDVMWVPCATEDIDLHAGFTETSLMSYLRPEAVRLDRAEVGNCAPLADILPTMLAGGVEAVSVNGVLGDPTDASPEEGCRVLESMASSIAQWVSSRLGVRAVTNVSRPEAQVTGARAHG